MLPLFSIVYLALFFFLVHLIAGLTKYLFIVHPSLLKCKFHESQHLAHFVHRYPPQHTKDDQIFVEPIKWKINDGSMETARE